MKIDRSKSKKSSSEVPFDCKLLIEELKQCNDDDQMLIVLKRIKTWSCGKCELYHWIDVLDKFDTILEECCHKETSDQWVLPVDLAENEKKRELLLAVISFTSLLIEHSFSRHLYNSIEHLITLLSSTDMQIVLAILNLLFVFSKRSNFFSRISIDRRQSLMSRLYYLAENWGGKDQGFGLAQCCQDLPLSSYPANATTFNFEFYLNNNNQQPSNTESKSKSITSKPMSDTTQTSQKSNNIVRIHIENVHQIDKPVSVLMAELVEQYQIPVEQQMQIFTQLRLTKNFTNYHTRLQCVQARINALSIMVYCQAMALNQEGYYSLLYNGLIEELVEVLELRQPELIEIKSASLKTLTSIIHLDRNSKMKVIIDSTGANSYHGFLPILVRNCIQSLISGNMEEYPLNFVTALFSFLYHLASYDNGCEALVQCGIMESLLRVVDWKGPKADADVDHLMFVTRAVRVIDLLTNQFIDMNAFQSNNGLNTFVQRLEYEVNICRTEQPYEIEVPADRMNHDKHYAYDDELHGEESGEHKNPTTTQQETPMEVEISNPEPMTEAASTSKSSTIINQPVVNSNLQCYPQRAALLKSMLNFLKKAVQCTGFSELVRPLMYGNFPRSLRHIISNAEYYGSSLFLLATDVVSVYVYQEPSLLSVIQDNGLTDVVLHALLVKNVPPTKEVLASLPTVFTSLCLNHRGLEAFIALRPFERFFKIFLSPDYLQAMRRRRSNSGNDTATTLGNAMDELMRHQPSLRSDVIGAILKLLEEICRLGSDPKYICTKASSSSSSSNNGSGSSKSSGSITVGSATDGSRHHHHGSTSTTMAFDESSSNAVDGDESNRNSGNNVNNDSSSSEEDDYDDDDTTTTTTTTAAAATTASVANQDTVESSSTNVNSAETTAMPSTLSSTMSNDDPMKSQMRPTIAPTTTAVASDSTNIMETNRQQIPLIDYILNVMRFLEAILANNSTDDHCQEFLLQNGLDPLFRLLKLPNLPLDFPVMPSCYSVATVLKTLLNLTHEKDIFTKGLEKMKELLEKLSPLSQMARTFNGSILLEDLINHLSTKKATNFVTPVLQLMAAAHAYIVMFLQICRTSQGEIRLISIDQWGSPLGIEIIGLLSQLYITLVWESTLLLGLNDSTSQKYEFVKIQIEKLNSLLKQTVNNGTTQASSSDIMMNVDGTMSAMSPMEVDNFDANSDPIAASVSQDNSKISKNSKSVLTPNSAAGAVVKPSHHHQKYIKPLLAVASRLGRALAELFGLLVKLCVGPPQRRRNHHQPYFANSQTMTPSKPVQNIAKHLNILLYNGLSWQPSFDTNIPKFRLTFYVCSIGFSSPMLFDDRKYPYHIMLRNFVLSYGQDAFFDCFHTAFDQQSQNSSSPDLPDGIVEFLDSWLLLLEKMTNPQTLLDSPHAYSSSKQTPLDQSTDDIHFDPIQYLIRTHKKAFPCIMELWNFKLYRIKCDRVIESLITIFSHLLKGETIIEKHFGQQKIGETNAITSTSAGAAAASSSTGASTSAVPFSESTGEIFTGSVDGSSSTSSSVAATSASSTTAQSSSANRTEQSSNVQTLVEMGFSRDLAIDALLHTSDDVNAATEWILQNFSRFLSADNEEEEMIRAIALSLSDNSDESGGTIAGELITTPKPMEDKPKQSDKNEPKNKERPLVNEIPLRKEEINTFTDNILASILKLIDQLPIIHKCCELMISISKRNGREWFEETISKLIDDIIQNVGDLQKHTSYIRQQEKSAKSSAIEWAQKLVTLPESFRLQSRIHLLVLLFNETKSICAKQISRSELLNHLIDLLENASYLLNVAYEKERSILTPKWVAPAILLIDLYEKNALASRRRKRLLLESSNCRRTWKYFDERTVRWNTYQAETNKAIDDAFRSGELICKISVNRRRYTVNFTTMLQINDDTDNFRPIMLFVDPDTSKSRENESTAKNNVVDKNDDGKKSIKIDKDSMDTKDEELLVSHLVDVEFLDEKQCHTIIEALVNFMQLPIDSDSLNANIRLVLRLTRNYGNACFFVEKNGISHLLKIPQFSVFPGFVSMSTLIIRHIMEDSLSLKTSMDKIIRAQANSPNSIRELHYMFRYFSPAACRDSDTFKKSAMNILRINIPPTMTTPRRLAQDDDRMTPLLRAIAPPTIGSGSKSGTNISDGSQNNQQSESSTSLEISKVAKDIICELLNLLPFQYSAQQELEKAKKSQQQQQQSVDSIVSTESDSGMTKTDDSESPVLINDKDLSKDQDQNVFRTPIVLSILAELTKSYHAVAKVICEHSYTYLYKESLLDDCTALSFILDNLLSYAQNYGDKECATFSRALFTAIASVPFSPDIHQTLVMEIKNALNRAVLLPESFEKHAKIQALSPLITSIVEAQCSSASLQNNNPYYRPYLVSSNPLIKLLIRKNLNTDLAKVIQYLDLSSPMMTTTVNSLLKTLDFLSKTLNTPQNLFTSRHHHHHHHHNQHQQSSQSRHQRNLLSHSSFTIPMIDLDPSIEPRNNDNDQMLMEQDHSENLTTNSTTTTTNNNQDSSSALALTSNQLMNADGSMIETETTTTTTQSPNTNAIHTEDMAQASTMSTNSQNLDENTENELFLDSVAYDNYNNSHPRSGTFTSDDLRTDDDDYENDGLIINDRDGMNDGDHEMHHDTHIVVGNSNHVGVESTTASSDGTESDDADSEEHDDDDDDEDDVDIEDEEEEEQEDDQAGSAQEDGDEDDDDEHMDDDEDDDDDDDGDDDEDEMDRLRPDDLSLQQMLDDQFALSSMNNDVIYSLEEVLPQFLSYSHRVPSSSDYLSPFSSHHHHHHHHIVGDGDNVIMNGHSNGGHFVPTSSIGRHLNSAGSSMQLHHPLLNYSSDTINNSSTTTPSVAVISNAGSTSLMNNLGSLVGLTSHSVNPISASFLSTASNTSNIGIGGGNVSNGSGRSTIARNPLPRARAIRSYFHTGHNWHVAHFNTRTSPTHILQRLLGSAASQNEFSIPSVLRNPFSRHELDETFEFHPLSSTAYASTVSNSLQNNPLNAIPSTIQRWLEEARLLDGEYMYDALLLIKPEIIRHLEKLKEVELQEKKLKEKEDLDATAGDAKNKSAAVTAENNLDREIRQAMQHQQSQQQQQRGSDQSSQFEELHAHIEQLTNSVINQVLESNPHEQQQQQQSNNTEESTNNSVNNDQISCMEVVISNDDNETNEEQPQQIQVDEVIPMSVVVNENIPARSRQDSILISNEDLVVESESAPLAPETQNTDVESMDHQSSNVMSAQQSDSHSANEQNQEQQSGTVETSSATSQPPAPPPAYQLTPEERAILGDQELPEGVDPSFLAALPENIRQEVIAEQFRIQRLNQLRNNTSQPPVTTANTSNQTATTVNQGPSSVATNASNSVAVPEISEDFLAALPPNIQEEVLAQQRAEQQRLNAQNTNPDTPVDPVSFFRSLPPSLRRQILSDLDDSQVQLLPPEFANEARTLRREFEQRNRQIHERLFDSNSTILRIIRSANSRAAIRYDGLNIPNWTHARFSFRNGAGSGSHDNRDVYGASGSSSFSRHIPRAFTSRSLKGKYLLDYDALSSILILLFIHDNLISSIRLHRVIRNLCLHGPTRQWVIQSLLEIMEKTKESVDSSSSSNNSTTLNADDQTLKALTQNHFVSWLSITLDSSFGSKTNVFYLSKTNNNVIGSSSSSSSTPSSGKKTDKVSQIYTISINPQASLFVCRNVLDILISLAKTFPEQFICYSPLSSNSLNTTQGLQKNLSTTSLNTSSSSIKDQQQQQHENTGTPSSSNGNQKPPPSFFDVLMRHDFIHATKKTKSKQALSTNIQSTSTMEIDSVSSTKNLSQLPLDYSPFSQLLNLLSHHFIKKSPVLTDRLIRLMTHITTALTPDTDNRNQTTPINLSNEIKEKLNEIEKTIANERLLKLVVDVLVSKTCSEDGLVDATSLLIKLSNLFPNCRSIFYKLLLDGVRHLGQTVYDDINALSIEMNDLLKKLKSQPSSSNTSNTSATDIESHEKSIKGHSNVQDRYSNTTIVINAQSNVKHNIISGKEVQLPSMSNLISKSSSQFLFLRILKIIMHIREINAKNQNSKSQQNVAPSSADPSIDNPSTSSTNEQTLSTSTAETKMEIDLEQDKLSTELQLDHLWEKLSDCLSLLSEAPDDHVVLVLQPAVESFFLVHAPEKSRTTAAPSSGTDNQRSAEPASHQLPHLHQASDLFNAESQNDENRHYSSLPEDTQKFLIFAEKHRVVLNQILRQSNIHLANGPFAVLVDHTRILDFDVKRRYFRQELDRLDQGTRRDDLPVHIRREHVFEDSYRELNRRTASDWKNRFYIVFEGEEGQDAGGLLREWYTIISREIFNPNYALFTTSPGDRVTYMINSASHCNSNHLSYFKFVGRVISKAIHDNKLLDCYFTRSFYKHILGKLVKYTDMESEDYSFYQGLVFLLEHNVNELGTELTFSLEIQEFGVTEVRDLVQNGRNIIVTEENKNEYVKLVCQEKMTGSIKKQLNSFLEGFYEIIPKRLISIFNEHELELLISGLPNIDIDDLKANTDYHKYQATSLQIQWFWRALRTFDQADRAKFLQFVTGTSKVPLQGFTALEGMNGPQKFQIHLDDRSTDRLPSAHTCFNQLDLPAYETYDKLRMMLLKAIHECSEGFGFA